MGRRKGTGSAEGSAEPTRKSPRIENKLQLVPPPDDKKQKLQPVLKPDEKKVTSKTTKKAKVEAEAPPVEETCEDALAENGDTKAAEAAAAAGADQPDEKDDEAEKDV